MTSVVKSRQRVIQFGEVITPKETVQDMLDLAGDRASSIDTRVLEPACGDGAFLCAILKRKLKTAMRSVARWEDFADLSVQALASLYGIDILPDNVFACKNKLYTVWADAQAKGEEKVYDDTGLVRAAKFILEQNIICGDTIEGAKLGTVNPIYISQWIFKDGMVTRRVVSLDGLVAFRDLAPVVKEDPAVPLVELGK